MQLGLKVRYILGKIHNNNMTQIYKMSPEEKTRLENLTPRPHGLVAGTMEYQEYFAAGTSSLSVLQEEQRDQIGKLGVKIGKLEVNTRLSEGDEVKLTDYKASLKELTKKDVALTKKLDSIKALPRKD